MLIIPAIDIKDGCVVRLFQGKFRDKKVYSKDPVKIAKFWAKQGAQLIHVVDLDGAVCGEPKNLGIVKEILKNVSLPIEFGGGVRTIETIKTLFDLGVYRVVLGTRAAEDRVFLQKVFSKFKEKIIISIDARDGKVLVRGWQEATGVLDALTFSTDLKKIGFQELIYTDITKDGTLEGPNIKSIKALIRETGMDVIASGGVSSLKDIRKLKLLEKQGVTGVIIGKALYEGKFTLTHALEFS